MSELLYAQRTVQNYLRALQYPLAANTPVSEENVNALVAETKRVPRAVRLNIYANAYRARMAEALSVDFNALHAYLGDSAFAELVGAYIERYPSRYFSLRNVGSNLASFLTATPPYAEHIEVHELAMFEWALCHAFDAADASGVEAAYFSALPLQLWPEMTLQFLPSLQLLPLRSNAPAIWKSLNENQIPPALDIAQKYQSWLIWRGELKILFRSIDAIEKTVFDVFMSGGTFADVCARLTELMPESEVPRRAFAILQQWLTDRLIVAS